MFSVDDMRSCIEEWFSSAEDLTETALTYHEIISEAQRQLRRRDEDLVKNRLTRKE